MDHVSVDIGQTVLTAFEFERQLFVINAQAMQDRRVQVVNVDRVAGDVV